VTDLLSRSQFVFEGTVQKAGQSGLPEVPATDRTAVVRVDRVLQAPAVLAHAAGSEVTVQLDAQASPLAVGERTVLFTRALAFGKGIAVSEVGRTKPESAGPTTMAAGMPPTVPGSRPGRPHPVLEAAQQLQDQRLRAHSEEAAAVVVGRILSLDKAGPVVASEHDPDWWRATISVDRTVKGNASGTIQVLYPNSPDVHWARVPKLRAGQTGLWILHQTTGPRSELAPYCMLDADDAHPADHVDRLGLDRG
jgi:hypothetical protein